MLERVIASIDQHQLLPEQGEIVVAVSGGADSLCLLHLLRKLCGEGKAYPGVSLHAAHLDHMLRGQQSADDASTLARLLEGWQVPFTSGVCDVPALAREEKRSLEDAARVARYRFLREVARGKRIAVAHHADDQVETLLLHWLRGSGLAGQTGMLPRQQEIIRPLLTITRAEIAAYCQEHAIVPLEDSSNSDPRFSRNRIRHQLLPLLQELNPGIRQTLLRNAEVARLDLAWLDAQVASLWPGIVTSENDHALTLDAHALLALPLSLQHHLLRQASARLSDGQSPLELRHLSTIRQLLSERSTHRERELHLPHSLRACAYKDVLILEHQLPNRETESATVQGWQDNEISLPIPGEVLLPGKVWRARADLLPEQVTAQIIRALQQENWPEVWRLLGPPAQHSVCIDGELVGPFLQVRTWRNGDRIQPLGMTGEKKVQDIFVDQHIPRPARVSTPLFFSEGRCLWVAGLCLDHRVRLTRNTRRIVRLSIRHANDEQPPDGREVREPTQPHTH